MKEKLLKVMGLVVLVLALILGIVVITAPTPLKAISINPHPLTGSCCPYSGAWCNAGDKDHYNTEYYSGHCPRYL